MAEPRAPVGAAFYARGGGRLADWWVLLHPPYTLWHLSYVAMGAALAPRLSWPVLGGTLLGLYGIEERIRLLSPSVDLPLAIAPHLRG